MEAFDHAGDLRANLNGYDWIDTAGSGHERNDRTPFDRCRPIPHRDLSFPVEKDIATDNQTDTENRGDQQCSTHGDVSYSAADKLRDHSNKKIGLNHLGSSKCTTGHPPSSGWPVV